jgi:PAS domain S-box-containing protein
MRCRRRLLAGGLLAVMLVVIAAAPTGAADAPGTKTVLLLHSETRIAPAIVTIDSRIRSILHETRQPIRFYTEYFDASWFPDPGMEEAIVTLLRRKYAGRRLDLVMPIGPAALRVALRHRAALFPSTPIVFAGGLRSAVRDLPLPPDVAGVWLDFDWPRTLELLLRLHPDLQRIVFVHGSSAFDQSGLEPFLQAFSAHRGRLDLLELTDLSFNELIERVAALPPRTVVLFFTFLLDGTGETFLPADVLRAMSAVTPVPIYVMSDTLVPAGGVGGRVVSFETIGNQAAGLARDVLAGRAPPPDRAVASSVYMFDARALDRWRIQESRLPPHSIVLNREVGVWRRYRWPATGVVAVVLLQGLLIAGLLVQRRQRSRARRALAEGLRFERLVSETSTTLAVLSSAELEVELPGALGRVAQVLGFERASLIEMSDDPTIASVTRSVAVGDGRPLPATLSVERFPWTARAIRRGELIQWSSLDALPAAAAEDRKAFAELGTEGYVCVPLTLEGTVIGALSLSTSRRTATWPDTLIQRSRLLADVFAHALVRRRAQTTVRESEARFRVMADSAPVMIWMAGTDGACTYFNRQWLEFTGRRLEDELGAGWAEGMHPDDGARCLELYGKHVAAREEFVLEYRLRRHDGEYRWVVDRGTPRVSSDGAFRGYIGACSDITEIKAAHEARLEAVRLRGAIFGSLYGHVAAVDRGGIIVAVNEAWSRFVKEEGWDAVHPPLGADYLAACRRAAAAGDVAAQQVEAALDVVLRHRSSRASCEYVVHPGESERWFEMTVEPFDRPEGGAIVTHIDITRRRRAEAEARREREELAHVLRVNTLSGMTAALAHEISQPLAAILSNAQAARLMLAKQPARDDEVEGALGDIADDAKRAAHVIRRLRGMVRKQWTEQSKPVDVNHVIDEVVGLLQPQLRPRGVALTLSLGRPLPMVEGDAIQLQQVLLNVLLNAVEALAGATTPAPVVTVRTHRSPQDTIDITVEDNGPGVSEDELDRIFEPFVTSKDTGLGMGLSISRSIVQAHGGRMWAAQTVGGGLTIHIELPCDEAESQP